MVKVEVSARRKAVSWTNGRRVVARVLEEDLHPGHGHRPRRALRESVPTRGRRRRRILAPELLYPLVAGRNDESCTCSAQVPAIWAAARRSSATEGIPATGGRMERESDAITMRSSQPPTTTLSAER
jgi:hypothetical protein